MSPRLYGDLASLWPALSPVEDYEDEAAPLLAAFDALLPPGRCSLLDLGTGGGHHLHHLLERFVATAVDLSPGMLAHSRELHPDVEHVEGDLRSVRLGRTFDAVLIHDAIAYMRTEDELRAAFETAAAHLEPGGALVVVPDWFRETFRDGGTTLDQGEHGDVKLTYYEFCWDPDPADTSIVVEMTFLVTEGGRTRLERDRHEEGLFPRAAWFALLADAGFEMRAHPYVGEHTLLAGRRR